MGRRTGSWLLILMLALGMTACSGSDKAEKADKAKVSPVETAMPELDNVRKETYENYTFEGYTGTMEYCYREDALFYHKWYLSMDDKKAAKKAYKALCKHFVNENGTGEEANAEQMDTTTWKTDTQNITVQCVKNNEAYDISFQVTEIQ